MLAFHGALGTPASGSCWCWCRSLLRCWRCSGGRLLTAALVAEISEIASHFANCKAIIEAISIDVIESPHLYRRIY
jgi:hypothetical protein